MAKRNARKAAPATAVKGTGRARRASISSTSTFDLSSNDNYSGVDDISDDEDDDEDDVFAVEEQAIMGESSPSPPSTPRPHDHNNWAHAGANDDDSDSSNNDANDDESDGSVAGHEASDEDDASWQGIQSDNPELNAELNPDELFNFDDHVATQRRVRFNVPTDDSSDESTEDDHAGMFPDIFVDQSTLDPSFRRQIENEYDESSASDSFWDHTALYNDRLDDESDADIGFGDASALHIPLTDDQTPLDSTSLDPDFGDFDNHDLDGYECESLATKMLAFPLHVLT